MRKTTTLKKFDYFIAADVLIIALFIHTLVWCELNFYKMVTHSHFILHYIILNLTTKAQRNNKFTFICNMKDQPNHFKQTK